METSTYSFLDLAGAIAHPSLGSYVFTGEGVGEINVEMAGDKTSHDVAADGSVMVSKIAGNNGNITIQIQQTSPVHKWMLAAYNYLLNATTKEWAQMACTLRNTTDGTSHIIKGMSFHKKAGLPYQAQGQKVSWVLMAADIQSAAF